MKTPKLCREKNANGDLAYVYLNRKKIRCGKWGTPEAFEKYHREVKKFDLTKQTPVTKEEVITINVLVNAFLDDIKDDYIKNGRQTGSLWRFERATQPLVVLYGTMNVNEFGSAAFIALRKTVINSRRVNWLDEADNPLPRRNTKPLSTGHVNQWASLIRHVFAWGVENEMVEGMTHYNLCRVKGIKKGKKGTIVLDDVTPVPDEVINATLLFLVAVVAAMVRLQRLTGMRPGEVCAMRSCDIDRSRDVWRYIPWEYKTEHHDTPRLILLGPECQTILTPYLIDKEDDPEGWLFSPKEAMAERHAKARERRKTPVQPSQIDRSKPNPKCQPGDRYTSSSYRRCIARAAKEAGQPHWFPYQIRHTALTAVRAKCDLEAAQVIAGHKNKKTTEIYAEVDVSRAESFARLYG